MKFSRNVSPDSETASIRSLKQKSKILYKTALKS